MESFSGLRYQENPTTKAPANSWHAILPAIFKLCRVFFLRRIEMNALLDET
jgi:hypothetical protein